MPPEPTALVFTDRRPLATRVQRALASAGIHGAVVENTQDLVGRTDAEQPEILVADAAALPSDPSGPVRDALRSQPTVFLCATVDSALVELSGPSAHLIAVHTANDNQSDLVDEVELTATCVKLVRGELFGLERYIGRWAVVVRETTVTSFPQKRRLIGAFHRYLRDLQCPESVAQRILAVADELIMNALLHGPATDGDTDLENAEGPPALVRYGCDGQRLLLSVSDEFGRLDPRTISRALQATLQNQRLRVQETGRGSGLGLAMCFRHTHQLVFDIHERHRSEVIAGWYLRAQRFARFHRVSKSLNIFWSSQSTAMTGAPEPHRSTVRPIDLDASPPEEAHAETASEVERSDESTPTAILRGRLGGGTDFARILGASVLDVREVTGATPAGLQAWCSFLGAREGATLTLNGCPEILVSHAARTPGFLQGVVVRSVLVPFECPSCGLEATIELEPSEVPSPKKPLGCQQCDGQLVFVGMDADYAKLQG